MENRLYCREIGEGKPLIILHGGPGFDHNYLLPEMDRLAESFRLIYYDQRGRGMSASGVLLEGVNLDSEINDVDSVRRHFRLESTVILGHSWGALLALEYAIRFPDRVSNVILLNPAPVSHEGFQMMRTELSRLRTPQEDAELVRLSQTEGFAAGDFEIDASYYRIYFRSAFRNPLYLDQLIPRLRAHFTPEGIRIARAIAQRLLNETWFSEEYNLLLKLQSLQVPALIVHGDSDFIPVEVATDIALAIPGAELRVLDDCGHFPFLECPDGVFEAIRNFAQSN